VQYLHSSSSSPVELKLLVNLIAEELMEAEAKIVKTLVMEDVAAGSQVFLESTRIVGLKGYEGLRKCCESGPSFSLERKGYSKCSNGVLGSGPLDYSS